MHEPSLLSYETSLAIRRVNAGHWPSRRQARRRARRGMRPAEVALLERYREELSGEVLEFGSHGDRMTGGLAFHAASLTGIASSGPAAAVGRERQPAARFLEWNPSDLERFEDAQFNAVVAGRCALDLLDDTQRRVALAEFARILTDDGVLIFSSHNITCESLVRTPVVQALRNPLRIVKLPDALRNRAHLARLQQREHGFAILNDAAANYRRLSYYISRDRQERQLFEADMRLLEVVTLKDEPVARGEDAYRRRELYYVAQPLARLPI